MEFEGGRKLIVVFPEASRDLVEKAADGQK